MLTNPPSISSLETEIRDFINRPRTQDSLLADWASWNVLCSALDVIGDTELALGSYLKWEQRADEGEKYLLVYGALQVMEVQQDAVRYVCETLAVDYSRPKELDQIRIIRNDAIGHAMRGKEEKTVKSSFIQRSDLTQKSFTLLTVFSDRRDYRHRQISIVELADVQRAFLTETLQSVVCKLRNDEMIHREQHKHDLLQDLFPKTLGYLFTKIDEMSDISGPCLREVQERLLRFRDALVSRNEWRKDSGVTYDFELAEYAAGELECFFYPGQQPKRLNARDARIFVTFLKARIEELRAIAKEIDDEYASPA